MSCGRTNWLLLHEAGVELTQQGRSSFSRLDLVEHVQERHPERTRTTLDPILQGMTLNAKGGPSGLGAGTFVRMGRGHYRMAEPVDRESLVPMPRQTPSATRRSSRQAQTAERVDDLIANFGACVDVYDQETPFDRQLQVRTHAGTIARLREMGGPRAAIQDPTFLSLLRKTLRAWGIGSRGSRLVSEEEFAHRMAARAQQLQELADLSIDDLELDRRELIDVVWALIRDLGVVENKAKIVAGSKTLHHLLPDLVVPIDGRWTGAFFGWPATYLTTRQEQTFAETYGSYIDIARATEPQQFVGHGWRTSRTKVLDNAAIGYCRLRGILPKA